MTVRHVGPSVTRRQHRRIAPALALVLIGAAIAGCGGGGDPAAVTSAVPRPTSTAPAVSPTLSYAALRTATAQTPEVARTLAGALGSTAGADSVAAGLHAQLAQLFTEHVHLTGLAIAAALRGGDGDDRARAARHALDDNAVELGEALGGYSPANGRQAFVTRWRSLVKDLHIHATEFDPQVRSEALRRLDGHADAGGRLLSRFTKGQVPAATATAALRRLHEAQLAHANALRNHEDSAFRRMSTIARDLNPLVAALAAGLDRSADLDGDARSAAATTRAELTGLMTTQLYQVRMAQFVAATYDGGAGGSVHLAAVRAAGDTTTRLGEVIARDLPVAKQPFDRAWANMIIHLHTYGTAMRGNDNAARIATVNALQADPAAVAKALSASTSVEQALDRHIGLLTTALATPAW
jgi:hypothetical protein